MKKTLILSLALAAVTPAFANLEGEGYYRVQNYKTDRYVSVIDNRGSIDFVATSADLHAIELNKNFNVISCNPASVLYVKPEGNLFNISSQGTSVHQIIDHYVSLEDAGEANGQKLYMAYGTYDGVTRYLGDGNTRPYDYGSMTIAATGNYRKWYIKPITADGDNFFGLKPEFEATAGKYQGLFMTICASFPMSAYSAGIEFYTVDSFGEWGQVTLKKIEGVIPEGVPVIARCAGLEPTDNRITVGGTPSAVEGNSNLKGVYFCYTISVNTNCTAYDAETMRVLGVCKDGRLGFVKAEGLDYIPANTAYLAVPAGSPAEFPCVGDEEFSGVGSVEGEKALHKVYTMTGLCLGDKDAAEVASLPAGLYIIDGRKHIVR